MELPTANVESLVLAARAIVARWDSPKWKDQAATAVHIENLRAILRRIDADNIAS